MFSPEVAARLPAHRAKKHLQWEAVKEALPGLQLAVSGEQGHQFMLTYSPHDGSFYESVVIGQLPQIVLKATGASTNIRYIDTPEAEKPLHAQGIDLSDDQIEFVLKRWGEGRSAFDLSFIESVWGADGKERIKP